MVLTLEPTDYWSDRFCCINNYLTFTIAGIIAVFVPKSFFEWLFIGSSTVNPTFWQVLLQTLVGPIAAFFTFIGSMGNIPLAAVLYSNGVSYAGIMAFIFSDLVVFPALRIQAKYYGWQMAIYILLVFVIILVTTSLILHFGFLSFDLLPDNTNIEHLSKRKFFELNYSFYLNCLFILLSILFYVWHALKAKSQHQSTDFVESTLLIIACIAIVWLFIGVFLI